MAQFTKHSQIEAAETKDLIVFYNENAEKPVKKFSDRETAVRRCCDMMDELVEMEKEAKKEAAAKSDPKKIEADKNFVWPFAKDGASTDANKATSAGSDKTDKKATDSAPKIKPVTKKTFSGASNSAGVAASWADPTVHAARLVRDGVSVTIGGNVTTFKSTRDAFRALRLMDSKHIRFRGILKAAGKATYTENGKDYHFAII